MLTKSKIFLLLYIAIFSALVYYAFPIIQERYFPSAPKATQESNSPTENIQTTDMTPNQFDSTPETPTSLPPDETPEKIDTSLTKVTQKDCDNNCKNFDIADEKKYCQEFCGLNAPAKTTMPSSDCEKLEDLEKDYCLKDLAVKKSDLKICTSIEDTSIKKSCQNRINEDLLDASFGQTLE